MERPLVFMMGRSPAFLPVDRRYARNHFWAAAVDEGFQFGLSAYAVRLLGDLRTLEWTVPAGSEVAKNRSIGSIEGSKAVTELYVPVAGRLVEFNAEVLRDPSLVNSDNYGAAWLWTMKCGDSDLLSPQQYLTYLEACWPLTQRILKGQAAKTSRTSGDNPRT